MATGATDLHSPFDAFTSASVVQSCFHANTEPLAFPSVERRIVDATRLPFASMIWSTTSPGPLTVNDRAGRSSTGRFEIRVAPTPRSVATSDAARRVSDFVAVSSESYLMLTVGDSSPDFSTELREQTVKPAAIFPPTRTHFQPSPSTPVMRPFLMPGTMTYCAVASALPPFLTDSVATALPPGRGPAGAMNDGTRSGLYSMIETVMPKRATGASAFSGIDANTGHSGVPTFALFDARAVTLSAGVFAPGLMSEASFNSQRNAGPDFGAVAVGAADVGGTVVGPSTAEAAAAAAAGTSTLGWVPVPATQVHLPVPAVNFWSSSLALKSTVFGNEAPESTVVLSTYCSMRTVVPAGMAFAPRFSMAKE